MATLLKKRQVREFALTQAKQRAHKFTRVGSGFYDKCEACLKAFILDQVRRHPSVGKTLR